ncbi:putative bifunctional diguanylate cyclase/phosphodiesterase [Geodermatophilus chilensis]|uniref:putative bifunctional diguanylate cyclase/phosphodiesterase n=1 Tax=Geodermatophilus chilensis TaxID=2035835 RepID=UPI000C268DEB|nr:EAL domain-containing protein [Geodermatophilus chilensis]
MPPRLHVRLLPGTPRGALRVTLVLSVAAIVVTAALGPAVATGSDGAAPGRFTLVLALHGAMVGLLVWRARTLPQERAVWSRIALAGLVFAAGALAAGVLAVIPATRSFTAVPMEWAPVAAFPLIHSGLVRWNRYTTGLADPSDVLNGISGVLAALAALNVVLSGSALTAGPWWEVQALLAQVAVDVVLLGTALSVVGLGAMGRDPRSWLVVAAFGISVVGDGARLLAEGAPVAWAATAEPVGAALLCLAAILRPARTTPQATDPAGSTIGSFVVITASTAVLVAGATTGAAGPATWCAALAALGASVRLLVNVQELAQLAVTRKEALTDELTGLANRRAVLHRVEQLCAEQVPFTFALLDLDKFKEVNDGLGHAAGDDLLRLVADRLTPALRTGDLLGRLGGDEFAVIAVADHATAPDAEVLGHRVLKSLQRPFLIRGMSIHVTASIGLTRSGSGDRTELLRQADAAMYAAKRSGTGLAVYDPSRHADSSGHLALVEELRAALSTGQLVLHHQPQVDVRTGRTLGAEALVRWAHPVRGLLAPAQFLPLAEAHGLMGAVTDEVLRQAVVQAADWRRRGLDLRISVNLSASNLLDTDLPSRIAVLLAAAGLPAESLVLEVTETVLMGEAERSQAVVTALTELGLTVSIDDFGTGYSSLSYLRDLPVAELKLDRSFTTDLLVDARTEAIVASTIDLAHRLGLRVVAEGVEREETLARLADLGCDESQGHLHAAALPAARFHDWLDRAGTTAPPAGTPELVGS